MSADEGPSSSSKAAGTGPEILACVSCRSRKLKCDRTKPACHRCTKVNGRCVYPESRRKPAFKRRNVGELDARLGTAKIRDAKAPAKATVHYFMSLISVLHFAISQRKSSIC